MKRFQALVLVAVVAAVFFASYFTTYFWTYYKKWVGWSESAWTLVPIVEVSSYLIGAVLVAWLLSRGPRREVRVLKRGALGLRDGDLGTRIDLGQLSMTAPVGQAFNEMAEQVHALVEEQEALLQSVAHETRTPLTRMRFILEKMASTSSEGEWARHTADIDAEVTELEALIAQVLDATKARHQAAARTTVQLDEVLEALVDPMRRDAPDIAFDRVGLEDLPLIRVEVFGFQRAIRNLLANAFEHAKTRVRIDVRRENDVLCVAVEDDGQGIPEADRLRVLEPFVRLDRDREGRATGRGLGLNIVQRVAYGYGHSVVVGESEWGGARMETRWPIQCGNEG